jgi:probable F420-dependent oxidoreductase
MWLDSPPLEALEIARNADRLGYDELWVGEMVLFDGFALASGIARETERISIVVGPLAVTVRSPVALALGIATVSELGGRPAHLALGASSPHIVEGWMERSWSGAVPRIREVVPVLRRILKGERVTHHGERCRVENFRLRLDASKASITIAAHGPRMLRAAAELGDRVVVDIATPRQVVRIREAIDAAAAAAGRSRPTLAMWTFGAIDPGPETLRLLARQLAIYLAQPGYGEMFIEAGYGELVARAREGESQRVLAADMPEELLSLLGLLGDADTVRAKREEFRAAGADVVAVGPATAEDPGGEQLLRALAPER